MPRPARSRRPRPWVVVLMGILILAVAGVVLVLPQMVDRASDEPTIGESLETVTPIPEPSAPKEPSADDGPSDEGLRRAVEESLVEGRSALDARDPDAAGAAFARAVALDPENIDALDGLHRTEILTRVRELEVAAESHERRGENDAAAEAARQALELDRRSTISNAVLSRVTRREYEDRYLDLVTRGLAALENGRYREALDLYSSASKLRSTSPEVVDGLERAREGVRRETIATRMARATDAESNERWAAAVDEFQAALALEPTLAGARDGLDRSTLRLDLTQKMNFHITNPDRLATTAVFEEATDLVSEARSVSPTSPQFSELIENLDGLISRWSTPVQVVFESDGLTRVQLFRVGQLGTFVSHTVELRPGEHTVIGRRPGFRDVRLSFRVDPGQPPPSVTIKCSEAI